MSNIFESAVAYALFKHSGQLRKNGELFFLHPLEVATIVGTMTSDLEILSAAVLHDVVEDTNTPIEDIKEKFGPRVAKLVSSETENKHVEMSKSESWKIRKIESLERLKNTDDAAVKMLWLGDKLSNLRSIVREYKRDGKKTFEKFNEKNPSEHYWYYNEVFKNMDELQEHSAYKEYKELLDSFCKINRKDLDNGKDR